MQTNVYIGGGALYNQVKSYVQIVDSAEIVFDTHLADMKIQNAQPFEEYKSYNFQGDNIYLCIGYKHLKLRQSIIHNLKSRNFNLPSFVHETAFIHPSAAISCASMVYPNCVIDYKVDLGEGVFLNGLCNISHNTVVENGVWFGPGVTVSGFCHIGAGSFIGSGAVISNGVKIGSNCIIGIGSIITQDIPANTSVIGNPMRMLNEPLILK